MKTIITRTAAFFAFLLILSACSHTETYQEKRDKEIAAINNYIAVKGVTVISEDKFFANDCTTDLTKNEFVLFDASGVYMQIVRKGCGEKIKDGETANLVCRFTEYNLMLGTDSITLTNNIPAYASLLEKLTVTNNSGTFSGNFDKTSSMMYSAYGNSYTSVMSGWLVPFSYINVGRPSEEDDTPAKVRLIVPHKEGHLSASKYVTPYLYELTIMRGR